jgi:hypothetical protein
MAQDAHADMSSDNSNMAAGNSLIFSSLQFEDFISEEKYSKNMDKFTTTSISSNTIFSGVTLKKVQNMKPRKYIFVGPMQVDITLNCYGCEQIIGDVTDIKHADLEISLHN